MSGGGFRSFQPNRARLSVSFFQGGEILMKGEGGRTAMLSGDKRIFDAVFPGQEFMEDVHKLFISGLPGMIFR